MNILILLVGLTSIQHCSSLIVDKENSQERIYQTEELKEVETYTTILLDDETFSIVSHTKHLGTLYNGKSGRKKSPDKSIDDKTSRKIGHLNASKANKNHTLRRTNDTLHNKYHQSISTSSLNKHGLLKNKHSKKNSKVFSQEPYGKSSKSLQFHAVEHHTEDHVNTEFIKEKSGHQAKPKYPSNENSSIGIDNNSYILKADEGGEGYTEQSNVKPSLTISISKNGSVSYEGKNATNKERRKEVSHKLRHKIKKSKRHFITKSTYNRSNRETKKEYGPKLSYNPMANVSFKTQSNFDGNVNINNTDKYMKFALNDSGNKSNNLSYDSNGVVPENINLKTQYTVNDAPVSASYDSIPGNKPRENYQFTTKNLFVKLLNSNSDFKTNEVVTNANGDLSKNIKHDNIVSTVLHSFGSIEQSTIPPKSIYRNFLIEKISNSFDASTAPNHYRIDESSATSTMFSKPPTDLPVYTTLFRQADIVQRNLQNLSPEDPKHGKTDDESRSDLDDIVITFDGNCDETDNQTCWVQREVGDVLTLALKIESSKESSSFQIRWMKSYHVFESKKEKMLEIQPEKLPWNMVSGSEGRELRLNPVTNTDIDPNCFIAIVFYLSKAREKTLFTELKKLFFRIDIPSIDMGKVYAGEELSIDIENFISLPERGNLLFEWNLETRPRQYEALPSNVKVSNSGRSVVLKELKKGRLGILNCVIYSPSRYAVAKRRFNILKIADNKRRRSVAISPGEEAVAENLLKSKRCRHVMRRCQEEALRKLKEGTKPKTRKKRFKRMEPSSTSCLNNDCQPLRKKVYSRWLRRALSGLGETTTEDPRLMPMEKLYMLSEASDGTLDDVIPREIHYVEPEVRLVPGTSAESEMAHPHASNCTSDSDCDENAYCHILEDENIMTSEGYCICLRKYYRNGKNCIEIPLSHQRRKRLKRESRNDFAVPHHLFYDHGREISATTPEILEEETYTEPPKILAFEEEESFLLGDCIDDKDCSMHASCVQPINGHPYCICRPGFRGNGIFCWEIIDYVPPEENLLTNEKAFDARELTAMPVLSNNYYRKNDQIK